MNNTIKLAVVLVLIGIGIYFLELDNNSSIEKTQSTEILIEQQRAPEKEERNKSIGNFNETTVTESAQETTRTLSEKDKQRIELKIKTKYPRAKELVDPEGYINVDHITLSEHIGKNVVLLDFWTYSCINCQRTLPYLTQWHHKYKDQGLVIIGIHTPEFAFEKSYDNVVLATERYGIEYAVVQDNDKQTWRSYQNRWWPRKYLIDIDGFITYDKIGEGAYDITEQRIVQALEERKAVLNQS